jgi:hypothetical protein
MKTHFKLIAAVSALVATGAEALAHPGSHIGAGHSHFFGGGEVLILAALAGAAAMLLHNRKG